MLCVYQRYPYGVVIALGVIALLLPRGRAQAVLLGLAALVFLADAGIAAFHVGVEQHWWAGTEACGGAAPAAPQNLNALMQSLDTQPVRCDAVAWSLFGISMAGYNFLVALALAAFSVVAARRALERAPMTDDRAKKHQPAAPSPARAACRAIRRARIWSRA